MKIRHKLKQRAVRRREDGVAPYDLFILAVTLLSFVNLILYLVIKDQTLLFTVSIIDALLSGLFFLDFLRLFFSAENKRYYFFRNFGWADLLASVPNPLFKFFRIFRFTKAYRYISKQGFRGIIEGFDKNRGTAAILLVAFIIIILLEFGSVGILLLEENDPNSNIKTASDAIWWVYVSITTVGYGDRYPVTDWGRAFATIVMLVGVGLFGVVTGFLANKFLPKPPKDENTAAQIEQLHSEIKEIRDLLEKNSKN